MPSESPAEAHARVRRVLLVDDNAALLESLAFILESEACEVRAAADGAQALGIVADWQPEVVFIDVHMPKLDGFEVARQLRARFPQPRMRLVLMSGVSIDAALTRHASAAGFDGCIDKMADPDTWLRTLQPDAGG